MSGLPELSVEDVPRESLAVVGLISGSQFVNHMYLVLLPPILSILATDFRVSLATLGIALGVQGVTNTAFQLPFGYLADNYDRTIALALSSFVGSAGALLIAASPSFEWLVVGQALLGVGVAGHHPTHYPLLSDATPERHRGRAFSVYGFGGNLGFAAPPVLITAVVSLSGLTWRHAVGLIGGFGLVYGVVVVWYFARRVSDDVTAPNVERAAPATSPPIRERVRSELRTLASSPAILALAFLSLVTSTANWGFTSYAVVFLTSGYGVALDTANLTLTGVFVVSAAAILLGGDLADRIAPGPVMIGSYAALVVLFGVVAAQVVPAAVAIGAMLCIGAARSLSGPARSKLTDDYSPSDSVGKSFAVITVGIMLGSAIAPPLFGYLIETRGNSTAFFAVAAVALLALVVTVAIVSAFGDGPGETPGVVREG
ncbi:MAG: MFS transporter [Haloferacaceae archaeon]